jgi:methyl-accepting chemotaxis protein
VEQVRRVTDLMGELSAATTEQTQGIAQVGHSVTNLDQVTQQNAALVEQSAAAAASLSDQAKRLAQAVSIFRTSEEVAPA